MFFVFQVAASKETVNVHSTLEDFVIFQSLLGVREKILGVYDMPNNLKKAYNDFSPHNVPPSKKDMESSSTIMTYNEVRILSDIELNHTNEKEKVFDKESNQTNGKGKVWNYLLYLD